MRLRNRRQRPVDEATRRRIINEFIDAMIDNGLASGGGSFTAALRMMAERHIADPHTDRLPPGWSRPFPVAGNISDW